ncbi:tyrosine-type recombinase/integrase [Microbacterium betulae]|uniref:Tyrosine-type recombinase/integrase n=1 Tax=Microbacterium betulae TaxID=2981139 RepID=A0AA97FK55_9MICO|nr:tyrosine-type recombinase/integrase [Microbacterium sp. AB]WOF23795.1 tyrosine-type recombinase/integrase [Microbacterium sp. AB]
MARAWITDRWVKDATVTMPDGSTTKISPTSAQLKSLKTLPEHFRTAKFGVGSRWIAGWYEPTATGQRQRQRLFARRSDAEAFVAALEDDIRSHRYIDPSARDRTYRDVAESWLASKNRLKGSSYYRYHRELTMYVLPQWGERAIGSITREDIDAWIAQLRAGTAVYVFDANKHLKKPRKPKPMSPAYLRHVAGATFGGPLRYAVSEQWIGRNPLQNVEFPRVGGDLEQDLPSLSYAAIEELASEASKRTNNSSDRMLVQTLAYSGPRIGEATALKIKDLDLDGKRARIHRTWTTDRDGHRILGPVKTWEKRWLPLPAFVVDGLRALVEGRDGEDFVFRSVQGAAVNGDAWRNRVWMPTCTAVGLAVPMTVHDLRHVAATNAIAAGADVKLVQRMLGHKDATETLNTYSHLWPDRVEEVIAQVEKRRAEQLDLAA